MMTLNDGRNELWQWDTGRKLTVDADCSQVHFSNKVFGRSIDVDVVDGTAAIPDVLLQVDNELIAWAFVGTPENGYTKISKVFKVNKRNKPADYVFTPPEQTTLGQIMKRLDRIEESKDPDAIKNAVDDYLANNPIQINEKDPTVPAWAKQPQKPSYSAREVGAEPAGTAAVAVSGHNASTDAHNDLRLELKAINDRLTAFFDSDDKTLDELSEIVAYITSNKSLIDAITTSKVSVSDIVDNLTTNVGHRPLSAAQGVVLKGLIDAVSRSLSNYQPKGDYLGREELPAAVNDALAQAKESGEFDGEDGVDGKPGKDGVSVTHVWDGTVLTVTSASGTSSADLRGAPGEPGKDGTSIAISSITGSDESGGENVVIFSNGRPLVIKNGLDGKPGKDGADGKDGVGIKKITTEETEIGPYTGRRIDIELTNGGGASFNVYNGIHGHDGDDGVGIDYVDTFGPTVDGYTTVFLHLTNGNTESFDVYHGENGEPGKDGTSVTVKSVNESNADGGSNVVTFSDGKTLTVKNGSKGSTGERGERGERGETGKTAYEYAKDGGYTGTEAQFSEKLAEEMPDKLPNPNALTIDGKTYDGSAAVDVQLPTELPNPNVLVINGKRYDGTEFVNMNIEGNVVSNWLDKSGQPGHILFRPFYEVPEVTLADNVEVTSGYYNWINYKAVADYEKVTVDYDGTTYICPITFQESHSPELGDESFFYIGNLNGDAPEYPFSVFGYRISDASSIVVGSGTHTLSVKLEAFVKKIDAKFLPHDDDGEVVDWDIVPKDSYTMDGEYARHTFDNVTPLVTGKTYIATVDGVECERVAKYNADLDLVYVGNGFIFTDDPADKNEDVFCYWTWSEGKGAIYMVVEDYASKTVVFGVREKKESGSSGGGVSSWNDLTDKPFYPGIITPVFDGDMTGRETVFFQEGTYAVKVSSQSVSVSDMIGATATVNIGGTEQTIPLTAENAVDATNVLGVPGAVVLQGTDPIAISLPEDAVIQGMSLSAGTWFMCVVGQFHVKSLSCLAETVEKINPSCLPDGYPYVETIMVDPTFDGDMTGRETFKHPDGSYWVKVTPQYISIDEAIGATVVMDVGGEEQSTQLSADVVMDATSLLGVHGTIAVDGMIISIPEDISLEGVVLTAGTWFICVEGQVFIKSLSCLRAGNFEIITKLDVKYLPPIPEDYLPESVVTEEEYNARRTHWTDDDGTVHQLDEKYIPAEWLAVEALTNVTFMPEATVTTQEGKTAAHKPFFAHLASLCAYHSGMASEAKTVIINFDGVRYEYEGGHESYGNFYVGNSGMEDTGEPFKISFVNKTDSTVYIVVNDTEPTAHTVSIEMQGVMLPVRMPEKYLPESVDGVVIRSSTANSTKKFRITVDDNGTLAATEVTQ